MSGLDCRRAQELFSDHADGTLNALLAAELEAHLRSCEACRALRGAFAEVVEALRRAPELAPAANLAERASSAALSLARTPRRRPAPPAPAALGRALRMAAAVALLASGTLLLVGGPNGDVARSAGRLADRAGNAFVHLSERTDRLLEDVRILRVVIGAAFEGRLDRVNDRFDDYRRLLERQRASSGPPQSKKTGNKESNSAQADLVTRVETGKERRRT